MELITNPVMGIRMQTKLPEGVFIKQSHGRSFAEGLFFIHLSHRHAQKCWVTENSPVR